MSRLTGRKVVDLHPLEGGHLHARHFRCELRSLGGPSQVHTAQHKVLDISLHPMKVLQFPPAFSIQGTLQVAT